jgi:monoamine oxidase/SAM-dependent methyltransferase
MLHSKVVQEANTLCAQEKKAESVMTAHSEFDQQEGTRPATQRTRVAIIGGGPGGLFSAWHLEAKAGDSCAITIYEASHRPGGKIVTGQFAGIGPYEAGVAEIYDYSRLGPDPLHDLIIKELGLEVKYISGGPCVINDKIIHSIDDLKTHFGEKTYREANAFREACSKSMTPEQFYISIARADNEHPWAGVSGESLLINEINDDMARRYIRAMAHSDVAAALHQTNGLNFMKNVLMDVDGYMDIFSVIGGNDQIARGLADGLESKIRLNTCVRSVEPLSDGTYRLELDANGFRETAIADYVIVALPLTALSTIHWRTDELQRAIDRHVGYFDRPGHYLRATLLFKRPFWRDHVKSDWWMLDAFDGCCVYDESARHDYNGWGALAFLIAGNAALALANVPDEHIEQLCLTALPPEMAEAPNLIADRRIHHWMASVNAIPGGAPVRPRAVNHRPDPRRLPGVIMVGDYMFDATLNGVLDSADAGTDIVLTEILQRRRAERHASSGVIGGTQWSKANAIEQVLEHLFPVEALAKILRSLWGLKQGSRILHLGSASGRAVGVLRRLGYDAIGLESNRLAMLAMPPTVQEFNSLGDFTALPFGDRSFDAVIETALCRLPPESVDQAIREIMRVTRHGMVLGSITTDLPIDLVERYDLLEGVQLLASRWDWSERLFDSGFLHALLDVSRLDVAWKIAQEAGAGPGQWYEDSEALIYCFFEPKAKRVATAEETGEITEISDRYGALLAGLKSA